MDFENMIGGMIIIIAGIILIFSLISYLFSAIALYALTKRTGQKHAWMSWVPLVNDAKLFNLAGLTDKCFFVVMLTLYVLSLVPYVSFVSTPINIAVTLFVKWRVAKNFGGEALQSVLTILLGPIMLWYFWLGKKEWINTQIHPEIQSLIDQLNLN